MINTFANPKYFQIKKYMFGQIDTVNYLGTKTKFCFIKTDANTKFDARIGFQIEQQKIIMILNKTL